MSTLTAGGGGGADAAAEAAESGGAAELDAAADAEADAPGLAALVVFGFAAVWANAAPTEEAEYAASGSAKVRTIVHRRRMRSFPFYSSRIPAVCSRGASRPTSPGGA